MFEARAWLQARLTQAPLATPLLDLLGDAANSVMQTGSWTEVPDAKPFISHRLGLTRAGLKSDGAAVTRVTPGSVVVYDRPGTYETIDEILAQVELLLVSAPSVGELIRAEWVEASEDLPQDPVMGTISRMGRFLLVHLP